jgi:glycosyltransferase involved in cell wall biosynthesis
MEAMACGCAVVSTDCGGASDIISHEKNGLIVPVNNQSVMVAAILRLLDDADLRRRFAAAGKSALTELTWPKAVESIEMALLNILTSKEPSRASMSPELLKAPR